MIGASIFVAVATLIIGFIVSVDWTAVVPDLFLLALMLFFLYWTTTLLPGPIKKVGKAAGKKLGKSMMSKRKHE